ncbi:MAG: hypothetical protein ACRD88_16640 [Terriglobia bacterium]
MNIRSLGLMLATLALLASAPVLVAQTAARPDLSGIWTRTGPRPNENFGKETPPLQAWAKAIYDENRQGLAPAEGGLDEMDPTIYCLPHGMPRAYASNQPFEILQTPNQVRVIFEATQMLLRRIYLDGRKLPENYPATFMGFSTGRYDGDTLVVETAGLNDLTWLDTSGTPHSDALRVTERIRRSGQNMMEIEFRFDDPKAFTRPWGDTKTYQLRPDWQLMENTGYCEDRFRYNYERKAFKGTVRWQSPEQAAER